MALSKRDKELIEEVTRGSSQRMTEAIEQINLTLQKYGQTLYGAQGDNGLVGDAKCMKARLDSIDLGHAKQTGMIAAISTIVTLIGLSGREIIKAIFGK